MIITRTPFRMPLGGGGTDLPSYYKDHGGFFISAALNKYMYIAVNRRFEPGLRISYSQTEIVNLPEEVRHPSIREALKLVGIREGIEIVSIADAPASTGLGSSGSFTVGLLNALYAYQRITKTHKEIAEEACDIAMNRLHEPSGKQDEYAASFGGIMAYHVERDGHVRVEDMKLRDDVIAELESNLLMFFTGIKRNSSEVLTKQQREVSKQGSASEKMDRIKEIGFESKRALQSGDLERFGELLDEHWMVKRGVTDNMSSDNIDRWYSLAKENGARGGKVMGAGGFLMLYCGNGRQKLRSVLTKEGLVEYRFRFDFEGSKVVHNV
jgi:D-glycero-alpha-D-manno-heptose-7-phosphate kinase